jgi:hypothetical protein
MSGCISYALEGKLPPEKGQEKGPKQQGRDPEKDFSRTIDYTYNPAKDAVILDHNLAHQPRGRETAQSLTREMLTVKRARIKEPVAHFFIRFHSDDKATKDPATLRAVTREALERFSPGLTEKHQYVATLHSAHSSDPHVHIVVNRIPTVPRYRNAQGKMTPSPVLNTWGSERRCYVVCNKMELAHPNLMRHLDRARELPLYIREKAGVYRGQQRDIAAGKTPKPSPRKAIFDAVIPALRDDRKTTNWYTLSQSPTLKQAGITVLVRTGPGSHRGKDYVKNFEPVTSKHVGQKVLGVRFQDSQGRTWAPKQIHTKFKASTIQNVLDRHLAKAQRIAEAQARKDLAKDLGLDKMHIEGLEEMRAERAKVDELKKALAGGEKKLDGMEKRQEEKEKDQGKGKENERSAWTYRGPDLDGR